jgi:hypothetical protein
MLSRIAPLHSNIKSQPPALPRAPPRKKTKKEQWEEEVIESVGVSEWGAMSEDERKAMLRIKRDREMGD